MAAKSATVTDNSLVGTSPTSGPVRLWFHLHAASQTEVAQLPSLHVAMNVRSRCSRWRMVDSSDQV